MGDQRQPVLRAKGRGQPAIGAKFESDDITIQGNVFYGSAVGVAMGGVSSAHRGTYEALRMKVVDNAFYALTSFVADVYSCQSCEFRNNQVWSGAAGPRLGGPAVQGQSQATTARATARRRPALSRRRTRSDRSRARPTTAFGSSGRQRKGCWRSRARSTTYPGDTTDRVAIDGTIATRAQ